MHVRARVRRPLAPRAARARLPAAPPLRPALTTLFPTDTRRAPTPFAPLSRLLAGKAHGSVARLNAAGHFDSADALWTPKVGDWMTQAEADAMAAKEHAVEPAARAAELMNGPEGQSEVELCPEFSAASVKFKVTPRGETLQANIHMTIYGKTAWVMKARRVAMDERAFLQGGGQVRSRVSTLVSQLLPPTSTPLPPPPPPPLPRQQQPPSAAQLARHAAARAAREAAEQAAAAATQAAIAAAAQAAAEAEVATAAAIAEAAEGLYV